MVYTHPLVTNTFHVQNSITFSVYSQNMLQNIIPPKILLNMETDHSITSHRGVIAPSEVIRHLNSVQALNAHACAVQTTNSVHDSATRWHQNPANKQLARMHTVPLGIKDNTIRVPTAVSFSDAGKIKACSSGRHFLSVEQKGDKSGPTRAEPQRVLLRVLPHPKEEALRPILDLRALNKYLRKYKFRMLTHSTLLKLVRHGD